jgi:tripartite-type tricarboxylate transporter receptor subunit TctC
VIAGAATMTIIDPAPACGPLIRGHARALGVTSPQRHPTWPDVPTMAEAGLPDLEIGLWTAFFAPAGTPAPVVKRLQEEVARVVKLPEIRERFAAMSLDPVGGSSEELGRRVARDIERWTAVAKAANIKND